MHGRGNKRKTNRPSFFRTDFCPITKYFLALSNQFLLSDTILIPAGYKFYIALNISISETCTLRFRMTQCTSARILKRKPSPLKEKDLNGIPTSKIGMNVRTEPSSYMFRLIN